MPNNGARFTDHHKHSEILKPAAHALRFGQAKPAGESAPIGPVKVILLVQQNRHTRMSGPDRLIRQADLPELRQRVEGVKRLLEEVRQSEPSL